MLVCLALSYIQNSGPSILALGKIFFMARDNKWDIVGRYEY